MLDKWHDSHIKNMLHKRYKFTLYCVKGNHEARPSDVEGMTLVYDENVGGEVWCETTFPKIKYFKEYGEYTIAGKKVLVIGGAYSVDKFWRLQNDQKWFANEQLTATEMGLAEMMTEGKSYDIVLTHTCPICWEPTDLFLSSIDQKKVDKTMEVWLDKLVQKEHFDWGIWLFGHYHADRLERPFVEQFYMETENLETIIERWDKYARTGELDWWLPKSEMYYAK